MYSLETFKEGLKELEIELTEKQFQQFIAYYELLVEKNKVMNLTGITEWEDVVQKHFLDSLALIYAVEIEDGIKVLDLGTGAGFPGIPLKIAFPQMKIVLLDSLNKRINFIKEVIEKLGLKGIEAYHGRAEEFAQKSKYREAFDLVVSRAVANLATLSEYCIPFVKVGGSFVSYKSGEIEEELDQADHAILTLGGTLASIEEFQLPASDIKRALIVIDKEESTNKKYPRGGGKPSKAPL